jgi:hypothetical protein
VVGLPSLPGLQTSVMARFPVVGDAYMLHSHLILL